MHKKHAGGMPAIAASVRYCKLSGAISLGGQGSKNVSLVLLAGLRQVGVVSRSRGGICLGKSLCKWFLSPQQDVVVSAMCRTIRVLHRRLIARSASIVPSWIFCRALPGASANSHISTWPATWIGDILCCGSISNRQKGLPTGLLGHITRYFAASVSPASCHAYVCLRVGGERTLDIPAQVPYFSGKDNRLHVGPCRPILHRLFEDPSKPGIGRVASQALPSAGWITARH